MDLICGYSMNCPVPTQLKQGSTVLKTGDNQTHLVSPTEANWTHLVSQTNPALAQITLFRCTCGRSGGIGNWFPCLLQYTFYSLGLPWAERHFGTFRHENIWKHVKYVETCENTQRRMKTRKHIQTHEKACENIFERMKRLVKT